MNEVKTRRPRRSKADIEEAINKAVVAQIKKKGFSMALVTDIVKRAKIEPIVFYNRYKNLDEFYDEFVKNYDYWLSDLVREMAAILGTCDGYEALMRKLLDGLLDDQIMLELLRWEVAEGNHITERTSRLRELHSLELMERYKSLFDNCDTDVAAVSALIVGGIFFLSLHKERSTFGGIDINTPEGKERVQKAFRAVAEMLFCQVERENDMRRIANNLRMAGVSEEVINRCVYGDADNRCEAEAADA